MNQMSTDKLTSNLLSTWATLRKHGRQVFLGTFIAVSIGLMCDLIVIVSLLFWSKLSHLPQAGLMIVMAIDLLLALVVAPLIGLFLGRRFWSTMERKFDRVMRSHSSRQITIEHERLSP